MMNYKYEKIQDLIKNIEEIGANGYFFTYLSDERLGFWMRSSIYDKLADIMGGIDEREFHTIELAYGKLKEDKKQKVFDEFLSYLKSTYLDYKRERIQLISKKQLMNVIEYWNKIGDIYGYDYADVRLLKSGREGHDIKNEIIKNILKESDLEVAFTLWHKKEKRTMFKLSYWLVDYYEEDDKTPYEFIVRVIDKINKESKFVEFVWDKDEE